jgi:MSHA pilin protein MshD
MAERLMLRRTRVSLMNNNSGFSLLELIFAIVVIGIGIAGFTQLMNSTTINSIDPQLRQQANAIARSYLEEISLHPLCDPGFDPDADPTTTCTSDCAVSACSTSSPSACGGPNEAAGGEGTDRSLFDDVCDYTNLPDTLVRDQDGTAITKLNDYRVSVTIIDDSGVDLNGLNSDTSGRFVRIDVNVTHVSNNDIDVSLSGYRVNF